MARVTSASENAAVSRKDRFRTGGVGKARGFIVDVVAGRPLLRGPGEILCGLLVHLSPTSPGTAEQSFEKSLKIFEKSTFSLCGQWICTSLILRLRQNARRTGSIDREISASKLHDPNLSAFSKDAKNS